MPPDEIAPKKKIWFKAKKYGWGWYPASWQGWGVLLFYLLLVILSAWDILSGIAEGVEAVKHFLVRVLILSFFLLYISYKKGEPPKWRWGKMNKDHDEK